MIQKEINKTKKSKLLMYNQMEQSIIKGKSTENLNLKNDKMVRNNKQN